MKKLLLSTVLAFVAVLSSAQNILTGRIVEGDQREGVIQATVALLKTDSTMVANTLTNAEGTFRIASTQEGRFLLRVTYVGYKTVFKQVQLKDNKQVSMGNILIEPDAIMLQNTTVTAQLAKVIAKEDTLIYNAGAYRLPEGSVVEELVKKLPGAEVEDDGTIKINGKQVKKILVDGKEFMTGDTQIAMKNLPTSIVERIKSYDEKSDMARISGIDDGEEQTVLDFGLKRGMNRGTFGNIDLAAGTHGRYNEKAMVAYFKDQLRLMGFGGLNNVNDRGMPGGGGRGSFGGGSQGQSDARMAAVQLNYEKRKVVKADANVRWNNRETDTWNRRSSENFVATTGSYSNSMSQSFSKSNNWESQGRVEWTPDTVWNFSFRPTISFQTSDSRSWSQSATFNDDPFDYVDDPLSSLSDLDKAMLVNSRANRSLSNGDQKRLGGSFQINRRLSNNGRNITLQVGANWNNNEREQLSTSDVFLYQFQTATGQDSTYSTNRYNTTPQKGWSYNARLAYSEPLARGVYLQLSYQYRYNYTRSDRTTNDFSFILPTTAALFPAHPSYNGYNDFLGLLTYANPYVPIDHDRNVLAYDTWGAVDSLSRFSEYNYYNQTAELQLRVNKEKVRFNVGVQILPQRSKFVQRYLNHDIDTVRTFVNWSPTADFRYRFHKQSQLRFNYRGSTEQPSMENLMAITDNSDPLNITMGNPGLKPSFNHDFRLNYNNFIQNHQKFIGANLSYRTQVNGISQMVMYDKETGGRTTRPENINGNWRIGGGLTYNMGIDTLGRFNINTSTDFNYSHSVGFIDRDRNGIVSKSAAHTTSVSERIASSYRNDWIEFEITGSLRYQHSESNMQRNSSNNDTWHFSYGFNTNIQAPWGMQFSTNLAMNSRRGYSDKSLNTNELIWNAQVSQGLLRGKPLTLTLQLYDLLHQQSNFSRSVSAISRSDSEYNAITSYVMLHAIYRFNLFGTKEARREIRNNMRNGEHFEPREGDQQRGNRGNRGGFGGGGRYGGGGFGGGRF